MAQARERTIDPGRLAAAFLAALLAVWTLRTAPQRLFKDEGGSEPFSMTYAAGGERLIHRVPDPEISYHLPASGVLAALVFDHSPPEFFRFWKLCFVGLSLILIYAACAALGAPSAGIVANAGLLLIPSVLYLRTGYVHFLQALWTVLIAGLWARRQLRPTPGRSAAVALAVGSSLLFRSVFAFLPPALALWSWLSAPRSPLRERLAHGAILLFVPYFFLVPWIFMNLRVHGEFTLFERGESIPLVIVSALGFVKYDYSGSELGERVWKDVVADGVRSQRMGAVLLWAARETLAHPMRFAAACAERARLIAGQHPALFVCAIMAFIARRRRPEFRAAALVAAYFFGIHCLLPYYDEYYPGLWVLLLVVVSAALAGAFGGEDERPAAERWSRAGLHGALALALLLGAYAAAAVAAYARAPRLPAGEAVARALSKSPGDAWLLAESGAQALAQRRFADAEALLAEAVERRPGRPGWKLRLAWARALRGDAGPLLSGAASEFGGAADPDVRLMRAHIHLKAGRTAQGREELRLALAVNDDDYERSTLAGVEPARRRKLLLERARLKWEDIDERSFTLMKVVSEADRRVWFDELARAGRARADADGEGGLREARELFLRDIARSEEKRLRRVAIELQDSGDCVRALEIFDRLCRAHPREAVYFSDRAICEFRSGLSSRAEADLKRAIELEPALLSSYATLGAIYSARGAKAEAIATYDKALAADAGAGPEGLRERIARARAAEASR